MLDTFGIIGYSDSVVDTGAALFVSHENEDFSSRFRVLPPVSILFRGLTFPAPHKHPACI
jgi:hypothetical protein